MLPSAREMLLAANSDVGVASFRANFATVEAALRDNAQAAIVIRGGQGDHLADEAAKRVKMPLARMSQMPAMAGRSMQPELETLLAGLTEGPAVLVLDCPAFPRPPFHAEVRARVTTRALGTQSLPATLRIVLVEEGPSSDATKAAEERCTIAGYDGFATREQLDFLWAQYARAGNDDVTVSLEPRSSSPLSP
jgi:hypothetical protein